MKNVLKALDDQNLQMLVWQQRYGYDWAVILAPSPREARWIQGTLDDSGLSGVDLRHYLDRAGLFPFAEANTAAEAIAILDTKLSVLTDASWDIWWGKVIDAYQALDESNPDGAELFVETAFEKGLLPIIKV